jgi:hypothetical protein
MALIAGHEVVGTGGINAFDENVVIGVACDLKPARGTNEVRAFLDEVEELLSEAFADVEFRP